ncbi:winged helix-turn-helix domain-containing protein [Streptomyces sp. NPDC059917]|uniref:winged helix-turn-helix domain-containing protein n=1 Tax=Streptomyces sp. NPDC059917 TaxID=3347002 RepID=UPI00365F081F
METTDPFHPTGTERRGARPSFAGDQGGQPRYRAIAGELLRARAHGADPGPSWVPDVFEIARRYGTCLTTARFARRSLMTQLRALSPPRDPVESARPRTSAGIADDLRRRIRSGEFRGRLPTQRQLALRYDVSIDTVSRAVQELAREGLLHTAGAQGTRVTGATPPPGAEPPA